MNKLLYEGQGTDESDGGGVRYEASSCERSSLDILALWACETAPSPTLCLCATLARRAMKEIFIMRKKIMYVSVE